MKARSERNLRPQELERSKVCIVVAAVVKAGRISRGLPGGIVASEWFSRQHRAASSLAERSLDFGSSFMHPSTAT